MYSLLLASAIALLFSLGGTLLGAWAWGWIFLFFPIVFVITWVLIARRISKKLEPAMLELRATLEAGRFDLAMTQMRNLLPAGKWIPLLTGQLQAQMGAIAWQKGNRDEAIDLLGKASPRAADGKLMLGAILYQKGDKQGAFDTLTKACVFNKKHSLLHHTRAWLLQKEGRLDDAIACLAGYVRKERIDEVAKDNLLRLQNKQRMSMQSFGLQWYGLRFEDPPREMGQMQPVRKGFRIPPKRKNG
ncbi:MAG: hypothetical protein IPK26_24310 [Planctomycetes bacterium]|nr:hypothetical protein [Planctomycetota bacterium]